MVVCVCVHCVVSGEFERYIEIRAADLEAATAEFYVNISKVNDPLGVVPYYVNRYLIRRYSVNPAAAVIVRMTRDQVQMQPKPPDERLRALAGGVSSSYFSVWRVQEWFDVPAMMEELPEGTRLKISRTFDNGFQDEYVYVSNGLGRPCTILTQF